MKTERANICECGHEKKSHKAVSIYRNSGRCHYIRCPCKKFTLRKNRRKKNEN